VQDGNEGPQWGSVASVKLGLSLAGARALDVALASIEQLADRDRFVDAAVRYARAVDLADELRAEWESYGRPKLYTVNNGTMIPHPLVKMLREAEADAARFGKALKLEPAAVKRSTIGRPPGASSAPDRQVDALGPVLELAPGDVSEVAS